MIPPKPILLQRPPALDTGQPALAESEVLVELVVDASGKVRLAEPAGKVKWVDPDLISAALSWKFIPAFKDGRPVASRTRLAVSLKQ